ncbi:MAG: hypothetical protein NUV69_01780 [Candidatus Curtissbacteria bacterium]|nr:hypothetical protein [Candidatus Curtissbacteria bacterium]
MIFVLHGDNPQATDAGLREILSENKGAPKTYISAKDQLDLHQHLFGVDLIDHQKVVIVEDFISSAKKFPKDFFENIPQSTQAIFIERKKLTPAKLSKLPRNAQIIESKRESVIFEFLDSLSPGNKRPLSLIKKLGEDEKSLFWNLQSRLLLMTLAKIKVTSSDATSITKRPIFDWQWQKIQRQADSFSLKSLLSFYSASLKVDFMIKNGRTDLDQGTLISVLLLKYLSR